MFSFGFLVFFTNAAWPPVETHSSSMDLRLAVSTGFHTLLNCFRKQQHMPSSGHRTN